MIGLPEMSFFESHLSNIGFQITAQESGSMLEWTASHSYRGDYFLAEVKGDTLCVETLVFGEKAVTEFPDFRGLQPLTIALKILHQYAENISADRF